MIRSKNRGILAAIKELKEIGLYNIFREEYEYRLKVKRDTRARESYVRKEGIVIGRNEGISIGKAEGKAEDILELLGEKGEVSVSLINTIMSEKNIDVLNKWLKLAAKSENIEGFVSKM